VFHVTIAEFGNKAILHCAGKIVSGHETKLLCAALGQHGRDVILDLSEVEAIDAAGVGALISLQAAGIYLRLMNPTQAIRELLRITKLDSIFEFFSASQSGSHDDGQKRPSAPFFSPFVVPAT
jgi:anti-anti-sigma factor